MKKGKFVISLDWELMWGVRDKKTIKSYGNNIEKVHKIIPEILRLFDKYGVEATFSTVGFLFFENIEDLKNNIPVELPQYVDKNLSPYQNNYFTSIEKDKSADVYHFAPHLIEQVQKYPKQEIGTHTFCHYYCLEEGQTVHSFREDIKNAKKVALQKGIQIKSLVFPRNQFNKEYLQVCKDLGLICYRGNENSWLYKEKEGKQESLFRRLCRLLDTYINISGYNCYPDAEMKEDILINIPSSRFLRPYSNKLSFLEGLRLRRIKKAMAYAAKNDLTYHLWWHPHNFGNNTEKNFIILESVLKYYQELNIKYGFESYTMTRLAEKILNNGK